MRVPIVPLTCSLRFCDRPRAAGKKYCEECSAVVDEMMDVVKRDGLAGALDLVIQQSKIVMNVYGSTPEMEAALKALIKSGELITKKETQMTDTCIDCDGSGRYPSGAPCKSCEGSGRVLPGDGVRDLEPCTQEARDEGCTCGWSSVNSASIDPPHEVVDKNCPLHGNFAARYPDEALELQREQREWEASQPRDPEDY